MPGPDVSVIVGAYGRSEYLAGAVRSLEAQTLARERFEIVVTKNFRSPELDALLGRAGATVLFDPEPRIGRWLRNAVARSTAPVVTFLNDDDEYEPERLAELLAVWRRYPDLGFFRNRVRVIDRDGRPVPPSAWRVHELAAEFDRRGPGHWPPGNREGLLALARGAASPTFNSSTMAIRRELLDGEFGDAFERTQTDDHFLFVAATLAPFGIYLDDRRLTRFRFTGTSATHAVRWLADAADSYGEMSDFAGRHGQADLAEWLRALAVHHARMFRGSSLVERVKAGAPRREIALRTGEYLRYLGAHPAERRLDLDTWAAAVYGLTYAGVPAVPRRIAVARPTAARAPAGPR